MCRNISILFLSLVYWSGRFVGIKKSRCSSHPRGILWEILRNFTLETIALSISNFESASFDVLDKIGGFLLFLYGRSRRGFCGYRWIARPELGGSNINSNKFHHTVFKLWASKPVKEHCVIFAWKWLVKVCTVSTVGMYIRPLLILDEWSTHYVRKSLGSLQYWFRYMAFCNFEGRG